MPKGKRPAPPKLWARIVHNEWQIYLPSGETLEPVREIGAVEAETLSRSLPAYWISFLSPVRDLTSDFASIKQEMKKVVWTGGDLTDAVMLKNSVRLFESSSGLRAVVFEFHH